MKKHLRKKDDEKLYEWVTRLADEIDARRISGKELHEILRDISVTSFIHGMNNGWDTAMGKKRAKIK